METQVKSEVKSKSGIYIRYIKRILDVFASIYGLILLSPILIIISFLIKLDSKGTIFFRQERLGRGGKVFKIIKFRTMVVNAENIGDGLSIKSENDNRITKVGKVLRSTSLDELPQLINVLLGHMSLVGPRPPVIYYPYDGYESYPDLSKKRFILLPGITGLSQVRERNNTTWEKRIKTDLEYIEKVNMFYDLKILFYTLLKVVRKSDVYTN